MTREVLQKTIDVMKEEAEVTIFPACGPAQLLEIYEQILDWCLSFIDIGEEAMPYTVARAMARQLSLHSCRTHNGDTVFSPMPQDLESKDRMLVTHREAIDFAIRNFRDLTGASRPEIRRGLWEYTEVMYFVVSRHLLRVFELATTRLPEFEE